MSPDIAPCLLVGIQTPVENLWHKQRYRTRKVRDIPIKLMFNKYMWLIALETSQLWGYVPLWRQMKPMLRASAKTKGFLKRKKKWHWKKRKKKYIQVDNMGRIRVLLVFLILILCLYVSVFKKEWATCRNIDTFNDVEARHKSWLCSNPLCEVGEQEKVIQSFEVRFVIPLKIAWAGGRAGDWLGWGPREASGNWKYLLSGTRWWLCEWIQVYNSLSCILEICACDICYIDIEDLLFTELRASKVIS